MFPKRQTHSPPSVVASPNPSSAEAVTWSFHTLQSVVSIIYEFTYSRHTSDAGSSVLRQKEAECTVARSGRYACCPAELTAETIVA